MATIVISTQYMENYAAHDWDGQGECPQGWKFKGGSEYKVHVPYEADYEWIDVIVDRVLAQHAADIETDNDYCREIIMGTDVYEDGYITYREKLQLEFDGEILFPDPVLEYREAA